MELQSLYPDKTILKVFAELFSKSDPFPFFWSFAIGYIKKEKEHPLWLS